MQLLQVLEQVLVSALAPPREGAGIAAPDGLATSKAVDAIARQPEADGKITKALLLGCALAEATAIYGFVIGLLIILFLK